MFDSTPYWVHFARYIARSSGSEKEFRKRLLEAPKVLSFAEQVLLKLDGHLVVKSRQSYVNRTYI